MVDLRDKADKLIDELIEGRTPEEVFGRGGLLQTLTQPIYERVLVGEITPHLGYRPNLPQKKHGQLP